MLSPPNNTPGPSVFQDPARPLKLLHTAPEVDSEPEPKKLCAPVPSDSGCKVDEAKASSGSCYCRFCDKKGNHVTEKCPLDPFYESDSEDDMYEEYKGEREGYVWNCLLGCSGSFCKLDHGNGITRGLYVRRLCDRCHEWGHCTSDCSIKPKFKGAADADMDMGETENTST
uniref:uncharacterized protein LOC105353167 isoform X2 n=1 Tax=Fragaria vesca subsp. vesca TaxID=101020 RepID=UPI0005C9D4EE|nr:PREDICTED: uncharacterized protein LOC105353167 isoform X2 [Fragaria vesca subsp. vesca]